MIAGPTSSGKTFLTREILRNNLSTIAKFGERSFSAVWCYGVWQLGYEKPIESVDIKYMDHLITQREMEGQKLMLVVVEDLMDEMKGNEKLSNIFTRGSHHPGISIIFIAKNPSLQGKEMRTISLNRHYIIIMKNVRDKMQMLNMAKQSGPKKTKKFLDAFQHATKSSRGYLRMDLHPETDDSMRIQTHLLPIDGGIFSDYLSDIMSQNLQDCIQHLVMVAKMRSLKKKQEFLSHPAKMTT